MKEGSGFQSRTGGVLLVRNRLIRPIKKQGRRRDFAPYGPVPTSNRISTNCWQNLIAPTSDRPVAIVLTIKSPSAFTFADMLFYRLAAYAMNLRYSAKIACKAAINAASFKYDGGAADVSSTISNGRGCIRGGGKLNMPS